MVRVQCTAITPLYLSQPPPNRAHASQATPFILCNLSNQTQPPLCAAVTGMLRRSRNPDFGKRQTAGSTNASSSKGKTLRQGNVEDESEDELQSYLTGIKKKVVMT